MMVADEIRALLLIHDPGLARTGHRNECGKPYAAQSVKVMLGPEPDVITRCLSSVCAEPAAGILNRFVPRQFH